MLVLVCGVYVCACINVHIDTQDNLDEGMAPIEKHVMNRMTAKNNVCMWVDN